jgi:hypothetical protein
VKKLLPLFLLLAGALVLGGVFFFIARSTKNDELPQDEAENLVEVALDDRPVASLTPSADGHWLTMNIEKIKIPAKTMDYELLYNLPDGRTQGVPGSVTLGEDLPIERELLLGSESSGKFRYDEGVTEGTLTLKFRNDLGKLVAKFSTKWHFQSAGTELSSSDGKFRVTLKKAQTKTYYVTMETFGVPVASPGNVVAGPYGVFSSAKVAPAAEVSLKGTTLFRMSGGKWVELTPSNFAFGIFIGTE